MRKIKLDTQIYNIRNKPMKADFGDTERTEIIMAEIMTYVSDNPQEVFDKFKDWQARLKTTDRREVRIRDYLLTILGSKIETRSPIENIWVRTLSIAVEGTEKEIEIKEDKFQFLKRIVERNKTQIITREGRVEEVEILFPYEAGQLLIALEEDKSEETKAKK